MPDQPQQYDDIAFWQGQLAEVEDEIAGTVGAVGFRAGSLSVDDNSKLNGLYERRHICSQRIEALRAGASSTANARSGRASGSW